MQVLTLSAALKMNEAERDRQREKTKEIKWKIVIINIVSCAEDEFFCQFERDILLILRFQIEYKLDN